MKTSFLTVVSVLSAIVASTSAFATGENTVTSKSYVDAQDALKQDKITAKTTGNVVTYNGTENGQTKFDEIGIYDDSNNYTSSDSGKLITAGTVADMAETIESITIPDNKLTCYNQNDGCTLWQISEGTVALTDVGTFAPLTEGLPDFPVAPGGGLASCKTYGASATSATSCCSGYLQTGQNKCGCKETEDCESVGGWCDANHSCVIQ